MEIVLRIILLIKPIHSYQEIHNIWRNSEYFSHQEWSGSYLQEFKLSSHQVYQQYIGWRRTEFSGEFINIDEQGIRKTWNIGYAREPLETIYVFGGSTMWGSGARDDYTIASWLSRKLNDHGYPCKITNYGETGYIFAQEVIFLIQLLKEGNQPDLVIFYDGVNDVYACYQSGEAGYIQNLDYIRSLLKTDDSFQNIKHFFINLVTFRYSVINQILTNIFYLISPLEIQYREKASKYTNDQLRELGDEIVLDYLRTLDLLDKLSQVYGFEYICLWQPVIFTENVKYENEVGYDLRINDTKLKFLYSYVNKKISDLENENFYNISNALYNRNKPYYIDFCHLSEPGNEVIADTIQSLILKRIDYE